MPRPRVKPHARVLFVVMFLLTIGMGMRVAKHKPASPPATTAAKTAPVPAASGGGSYGGTTLTDTLARKKREQLDAMMKADAKARVEESHRARDNLAAEHPAPVAAPGESTEAPPATPEVTAEELPPDEPAPEPSAKDQLQALRCAGNNAAVGGCVH